MSYNAKLNALIEDVEKRTKFDTSDADEFVNELWSEILQRGLEAEVLAPLLLNYIRDVQRRKTRALERPPKRTKIASIERIGKDDPLTADQRRIKEYLGQTLFFGGKYVVVATATKHDWKRRLDMLKRQRNGIESTVAQCERVVELFEQLGAKTTGDIPVDTLASTMYEPEGAQSLSA